MRSFIKASFTIALLTLTACTAPGYQKMGQDGFHRTGYEDTKLTETQYRVRYLDVSPQKAYRRGMRRAAEIAMEHGYSYFKITQSGPTREHDMILATGMLAQNIALEQFEATIILLKKEEGDATNAKEFLANEPELQRSVANTP